MQRRDFVKRGISAAAALPLTAAGVLAAQPTRTAESGIAAAAPPFKLKFSPEFGIFEDSAGKDPVAQIEFAHAQGFRAFENTWLKSRSVAEQELISRTLQRLGMEFGQFVGTVTFSDVTFAGRDAGLRGKVLDDIRASVDVAKRMNTRFVHNVLGKFDQKSPMEYQMANAIELLKRVAGIYEPHGIVCVIETMNWWHDHPGMFLHTIPQAYALASAVNSPSLKLLFDVYHVQIQEGNVIANLDRAWDQIAYIQVGDAPGRKEPTTGEINYPNVLRHIHNKGYRGFFGLEHGSSRPGVEGERAILQAYRSIDLK